MGESLSGPFWAGSPPSLGNWKEVSGGGGELEAGPVPGSWGPRDHCPFPASACLKPPLPLPTHPPLSVHAPVLPELAHPSLVMLGSASSWALGVVVPPQKLTASRGVAGGGAQSWAPSADLGRACQRWPWWEETLLVPHPLMGHFDLGAPE